MWLGATAVHRVITRSRDIKGFPLTRFEELEVARASMTLDVDGGLLSARLVLESVRLERRDGRLVATDFDLDAVLLRWEAAVP